MEFGWSTYRDLLECDATPLSRPLSVPQVIHHQYDSYITVAHELSELSQNESQHAVAEAVKADRARVARQPAGHRASTH